MIEYQGIFFDKDNSRLLDGKLKEIQNEKNFLPLERDIKDKHITFWYMPKANFPGTLLDKEFEILVTGFGQNKDNCGFRVEVPAALVAEYRGAEVPHITMQISKNGKTVNTADLNFENIAAFPVKGKLAYVIDNKVLYSYPQVKIKNRR